MTETFKLVVADPPWAFGDKLPGKSRGAAKNYSTMKFDQICRYLRDAALGDKIADDAVLLLWRVSAMPTEALAVCTAWGFTPKSEMVWVKQTSRGSPRDAVDDPLHFGMGRYVRGSHETCLIATRGKVAGLVKNHSTRSVFFAPVGKHSAKPGEFYRIAEKLFEGPRLELFARKRRDGWEQIGDELEGAPR